MQHDTTSSRLLTRDEAADFLGLKPQTLAVWHSLGKDVPRMVKMGRSVRYRISDLEQWIEGRTVRTTAEAEALGA